MDWQEITALGIVASTALIFAASLIPRRRLLQKKIPCGCSTSGPAPSGRIIYSARKGERPRVLVKTE